MAKRFGDGERQHIYHQPISTLKPNQGLQMPQPWRKSMNDLHETAGSLVAAKAVRADARVRLKSAAVALARAQRMDEAARTKVLDLEQAVIQAQTEHGQQLAASLAAGDPNESLPTPDWDVIPKLTSAKVHAAITAEALKSLQSTHADATTALKAAEAAVGKEADRILNAQAEALAAEVERAANHLAALGEELREFAPDGDGRLNSAWAVASPRVFAALKRMPAVDDLNTPINQLRAVINSPLPLEQRRKALVADDTSGEHISDSIKA
jgi:hypothetical protein